MFLLKKILKEFLDMRADFTNDRNLLQFEKITQNAYLHNKLYILFLINKRKKLKT